MLQKNKVVYGKGAALLCGTFLNAWENKIEEKEFVVYVAPVGTI